MKKNALIAAVLVLSAALTTACGSSELNDEKLSKPEPPVLYTQPETAATTEPTEPTTENKNKSLEERVVDKLSPVTWKYDKSEIKTQIVGNDEFGYIEIPEDWFLDEDVAALTDDILTYENDMYILNGDYAMDSMIMDKCDADFAHSEVESILREAESDQRVTEVAYEYPEVDGREAVFIEFKYNDINKLRYTLLIGNEEQTEMHIITYESSNPNIVDLLRTYTRKAPEGMSTDTTSTGDSTETTDATGTETGSETDTTTTATTTTAAE
ncbi:MAG: hypothetical protein IKP78_05270 [Ruminococcus sp.]|nr:hypothetical protein [Ruminococcus sp.]